MIETAETVFDKAEEMVGKALESETGRKVAAAAEDLAGKAMNTDIGRKAAETAADLGKSEAGTTTKALWNTPLGRNIGVGAAAGAALGMVILNPFIGAAIGGGLGYLRTLAKKN